MENHRMYGTYEIYDTDDKLQITVAIKKEKDREDIDNISRENDNIVRLPWRENPISKDIGRASSGSNNVVLHPRMQRSDADPCVKKRRLRARWEHIEGVGLRCRWIEEPEGESDATPEARTEARTEANGGVNSTAGNESGSRADAK
jgi:hypothetical protein